MPYHITEERRDWYRRVSMRSRTRKAAASTGDLAEPRQLNVPNLDPTTLMPAVAPHGLRALSLFSGGGGLDLGFERAGFEHVASFDVLDICGATLSQSRPHWSVFSGREGDVTRQDWARFKGLSRRGSWRAALSTVLDCGEEGRQCRPSRHVASFHSCHSRSRARRVCGRERARAFGPEVSSVCGRRDSPTPDSRLSSLHVSFARVGLRCAAAAPARHLCRVQVRLHVKQVRCAATHAPFVWRPVRRRQPYLGGESFTWSLRHRLRLCCSDDPIRFHWT